LTEPKSRERAVDAVGYLVAVLAVAGTCSLVIEPYRRRRRR
jgi:hypothetical protein